MHHSAEKREANENKTETLRGDIDFSGFRLFRAIRTFSVWPYGFDYGGFILPPTSWLGSNTTVPLTNDAFYRDGKSE
jgi:hypothetical protein